MLLWSRADYTKIIQQFLIINLNYLRRKGIRISWIQKRTGYRDSRREYWTVGCWGRSEAQTLELRMSTRSPISSANFLKLRIGDMVFVDITLLTPSSAIIRTQSQNNNQHSGLTAFMGFHCHFHISILL